MAYGFNDDKSKVEVLGREEVGFMGKLIRLKSEPIRVRKGSSGRKAWSLEGNKEDYIILAVNVDGITYETGEPTWKTTLAHKVEVYEKGESSKTTGNPTPYVRLITTNNVLNLTAEYNYIDDFDVVENPPSYVYITFEVLLMDVSGLQPNE